MTALSKNRLVCQRELSKDEKQAFTAYFFFINLFLTRPLKERNCVNKYNFHYFSWYWWQNSSQDQNFRSTGGWTIFLDTHLNYKMYYNFLKKWFLQLVQNITAISCDFNLMELHSILQGSSKAKPTFSWKMDRTWYGGTLEM